MFNYFSPVIYVQLSPKVLTVRNSKTGEIFSGVPEIAFASNAKKVLAIGNDARKHQGKPSVNVINPFTHPRSLLSDFTVAEATLKAFLLKLRRATFLHLPPRVVLHLPDEPLGGYTQVEIRAFHELGTGAGASKVTIWLGPALSDQELLSGDFPIDGTVLS